VNWRPEVINVAFMAVGRSEQREGRGVCKGILGVRLKSPPRGVFRGLDRG
jgi:hypothetical protein